MQFRTPQFIEIEDKIFGPFTFKQFIYLVGGGSMCYLAVKVLPGIIAYPLALGIAALSMALAFYKVNNRTFFQYMQSYLKYTFTSKLYIWKKVPPKKKAKTEEEAEAATSYVPKLSDSKLKDISWSLDVINKAPEK